MKKMIKFATLGLALVLIGMVLFYLMGKTPPTGEPQMLSSGVRPTGVPSPLLPSSRPSPSPSVSPKVPSAFAWNQFKVKFGEQLKPEFLKNGRLVAVRSLIGEGKPASGEAASPFRLEDSERVKARAQEILAAAEDLLEIKSDWPLIVSSQKQSPISAQVFFIENHNGIPVKPGGGVTISLGSRGELMALHSDYMPTLTVVNDERLTQEEAERKAVLKAESMPSKNERPAQAGGRVIWIVDSKKGRIAFQFQIHGYQIIIDAQTGDVLSARDMRQF